MLAHPLGDDGGGALDRLVRAVETFGFHLAALDLRQNADVHERVVAELLEVAGVEADYAALDEAERVALLRRELGGVRLLTSPFATYSDETRSELEIVRAAAEAHASYGPAAITAYIISKTDSLSDLLEVNVLLKEAGLWRAGETDAAGIMVVPLFETIADLRRAPEIMARMARPARGRAENGRARLSGSDGRLFRFEQGWRLPDLGVEPAPGEPRARHGVRDGRGGDAVVPRPRRRGRARRRIELRGDPRAAARAPSRDGSGSPSRARSSPPNMATRKAPPSNLEAMTSATLLASLEQRSARRRDIFYAAMDEISDTAFHAYRELVYGTEGFRDFFRQMTPIAEIAELKIGSRPASRTQSDLIEDLRAIPWVFSWSQARVMLPGWFGIGHALSRFGDKGLLRDMVEAWPFFRTTLDNMEMVLAKSDMAIAGLYAGLVQDPDLARAIFGRIRDGWEMTRDALLEATGQTRLLEKNPALDESIRLRLPYIEPLNHLQIELLKRHRAGEDDPRIREGIQLSINAIATALRNSG